MTHKSMIKNYLKGKDWTMGAEIKRYFANEYVSDADRRCREMAEAGELESEIRNGKVYYRISRSDIVKRFEAAKPRHNLDNYFGEGFEDKVKSGRLFNW